MKAEIKEGDIVFTTLYSLEQSEFSDCDRPNKPREVKAHWRPKNLLTFHFFNKETGNISENHGASYYPSCYEVENNKEISGIFATKEEAIKDYAKNLIGYSKEIEKELQATHTKLIDLGVPFDFSVVIKYVFQ